MAYRVLYRQDRWQHVAGRAIVGQQVITQVLGPATHLVVVLVLTATGRPQIVSASIEQLYVTRHAGRKWQVVERLRPYDIELVAARSLDRPPDSPRAAP